MTCFSTEMRASDEAHWTYWEPRRPEGLREGFVYLRVDDFSTTIIRYEWVEGMIIAPDCPIFNTRASFFEYLRLNKVWGGLSLENDRIVVIPDYDVPGTSAVQLNFEQLKDQLKLHPFIYTSEA